MNINWHFPDNGGGLAAGFNDSAIDHFKGQRLSSLVREVVQNSLDARSDPNKPVKMSFSLEELDSENCPELEMLRPHLSSAKSTSLEQDLEAAAHFYDGALEKLDSKKIKILCVHDANTYGLRGPLNGPSGSWFALTKGSGLSQKQSEGSLGSFGHGSKAPFAISDIRTVFYYSVIKGDAGFEKRFQGKSILQSHINTETKRMTQGTGFFGQVDECHPLVDAKVPDWAQNLRKDEFSEEGTSILIPHTFFDVDLYPETAITLVANFYFAISSGNLEVQVGDQFHLTKENVAQVYQELKLVLPEEQDEIDATHIEECFKSVETIVNPDHEGEQEVPNFGLIKWFMRVSDNVEWKRVAIARQNGMLITRRPPFLERFQGVKNFDLFICVQGQDGSEILKRIENPQHDNFQFDRIDDADEREVSKKRYRTFSKKAKEIIQRHASIDGSDAIIIDDLADLFSEISNAENNNDASRERSRHLQLSVGAFNFRQPPPRPNMDVPGASDEADLMGRGDLDWDNSKETDGGSEPDKNGTTETFGSAEEAVKPISGKRYKLENLRMRTMDADTKGVLVYFDAPATGKFALEIYKSGEVGSEQVDLLIDGEKTTKSLLVEMHQGKRESVLLAFVDDLGGHAIEAMIDEIAE